MPPETPNPFQPPESSIEMHSERKQRPNIFDWFFAIFLSLVAIAFVLPTTCFGSAMVFLTFADIHDVSYIQNILAFVLLIICVVITLGSAVWVARLYINAVKKAQKRNQTETQRLDSDDSKA